jgi:hypothetical protein
LPAALGPLAQTLRHLRVVQCPCRPRQSAPTGLSGARRTQLLNCTPAAPATSPRRALQPPPVPGHVVVAPPPNTAHVCLLNGEYRVCNGQWVPSVWCTWERRGRARRCNESMETRIAAWRADADDGATAAASHLAVCPSSTASPWSAQNCVDSHCLSSADEAPVGAHPMLASPQLEAAVAMQLACTARWVALTAALLQCASCSVLLVCAS